jgi:acetyl esterase/lipase
MTGDVRSAGERYHEVCFARVDVTPGLPYAMAPVRGGEVELHLDLYEPHGDPLDARPSVLYIHGGDFFTGDSGEGEPVARALARRGYVVACMTYRLLRHGPDRGLTVGELSRESQMEYFAAFKAAFHDAQAAVRWLRAHAGERRLDHDAIAAMGWSAGGATALHLSQIPELPGDNDSNPGHPAHLAGAVALSGFSYRFAAGSPPVLMLHGEDDKLVPLAWAERTAATIREHGGPCRLVAYPGAGHDLRTAQERWEPEVVRFLADVLGSSASEF